MNVIRPIEISDLDQLAGLAGRTSFGLTSLPRDREMLAERIRDSALSFESEVKKRQGETYLFVMENLETRRVVGTCGVTSKVGGFEPFYSYRVETSLHESIYLNVRKEVRVLHLEKEHSGPSEIGSLFLSPEHRQSGCGRFLSLSRFLFMAEMPDRFETIVIAEMRGVIDAGGRSPFWEAVGRHFFDIDFARADYLSVKDKGFIAELMPHHPIYTVLLPREAQEVIGQVHPDTRPALRLLERESFELTGQVDIFEGGPIVGAPLDKIRTARESVRAAISEIAAVTDSSETLIISNARLDFRACMASVDPVSGGVRIEKKAAGALNLREGDSIRFAPLRPRRAASGT